MTGEHPRSHAFESRSGICRGRATTIDLAWNKGHQNGGSSEVTTSDDAKGVLSAIRLGWYVAEVRGRNRPGAPPGSGASMPDHLDHALPLHVERGDTELRIEVQAVVTQLAQELGVGTEGSKGSYGTTIDNLAKALHVARNRDPGKSATDIQAATNTAWEALADLLWKFDAHIQDGLTANSVIESAAYQLGRGLTEAYWALDPSKVDGSSGWTFLLGNDRCDELSHLIGRLDTYFNEYTASSVAGSIEVWRKVASDPNWRGDNGQASKELYLQIRRWYELVILGQDPTTLVKPGQVMRNFRTIGRAIKFFWFQMLAVTGAAGALAYLGYQLSANSQSTFGKVAAGALGAVGLSFAGLTGFLKNSAQAMLKRLRQDAYTELIAIAVQTAPKPPGKLPTNVVRKAISARLVTPQTPN